MIEYIEELYEVESPSFFIRSIHWAFRTYEVRKGPGRSMQKSCILRSYYNVAFFYKSNNKNDILCRIIHYFVLVITKASKTFCHIVIVKNTFRKVLGLKISLLTFILRKSNIIRGRVLHPHLFGDTYRSDCRTLTMFGVLLAVV